MSDTTNQQIVIDLELLRALFDSAVASPFFGSGVLDDEEVTTLRRVAVIIGVDPMVATPHNFQCRYTGAHNWHPLQNRRTGEPARQADGFVFPVRKKSRQVQTTTTPERPTPTQIPRPSTLLCASFAPSSPVLPTTQLTRRLPSR